MRIVSGPGRLLVMIAAVVALSATMASSAAADTRYASPKGSGFACTVDAPCALDVAVGNFAAHSGDTVQVASGTYRLSVGVVDALGTVLSIRSDVSQPPPVILSSAPQAVVVSEPSSTVDRLDIVDTAPGGAALNFNGAFAERVFAYASSPIGQSDGCYMRNGLLYASVCVSEGAGGAGVATATSNGSAVRLRGVTAIGRGPMSLGIRTDPPDPGSLELIDTIARGTQTDITTQNPSTTVNASYSNFATVDPVGSVADGGHNQTAAPLFLDASRLDYHEAPGSPTIGRGLADLSESANTDIDLEPRTRFGQIDIGADEFPSLVPVTGGTPGGGGTGTPGAGGPGTTVPAPDKTAPVFSKLSLSVASFAAKVAGHKPKPRLHYRSSVRFKLSEAASVRATVLAKKGRRWVSVGIVFTKTVKAGAATVSFSGKVGHTTLKPGSYRLALVATDAAKNHSPTKTLSFRVVKG